MLATKYKIWSVGNPVGIGATGALHVGIAGIAKPNSPALPLVVPNELVCGLLARAILLPTPPGFIIEHNSERYYVSLNFNLAGQDLPPADASKIVASHQQLAAGIVLFDIWIANNDRHNGNIAYDQTSDRVEIFDHSHVHFSDDSTALAAKATDLAIGSHCLASELLSLDGMVFWNDRIQAIPEFYIRATLDAAVEVGLPLDRVDPCLVFLLDRRTNLLDLVKTNRGSFPKVNNGLFDTL